MVADGLIQPADQEAAVLFAKRRALHVEEALLQMGLLDEMQLLKFQAHLYQTYFVSTRRSRSRCSRSCCDADANRNATGSREAGEEIWAAESVIKVARAPGNGPFVTAPSHHGVGFVRNP